MRPIVGVTFFLFLSIILISIPSAFADTLYVPADQPTIENCTISGNLARFGGSISCMYWSSMTIKNCILW